MDKSFLPLGRVLCIEQVDPAFALGHVGYGQPFLLLGVTVLSVIYGLLARWRGNVWAAVVAHTLFDAVQLLVIIPLGIEASGEVSAFVAPGFIW